MGIDVLQDLVESRDLDPAVLDELPTFTLHGAAVEWRPDEPDALRSLWPDDLELGVYRCLLGPGTDGCPDR